MDKYDKVDDFMLDRFCQSCVVLDVTITNFKLIKSSKWDTYEDILLRGLLLDSIECLYIVVPSIFKEYFASIGIYELEYRKCDMVISKSLSKSSWVSVLNKALELNLISKNLKYILDDIFRIRGTIIHSEHFTKVSYYSLIMKIIIRLSRIKIETFKDIIISIHDKVDCNIYILSEVSCKQLDKLQTNLSEYFRRRGE